ncbi:Hypothetical predicted protein [Pelobates cultripes]|nr:Hypothetical predicted protein [Pelobates cultripes]
MILTAFAIMCSVSYHKRSRQYKRAREYEDKVRYKAAGSPIHITGIKRVLSIHKPFILMRKQESTKHSSQVYFIYDNPAMAATESEVQDIHEPLKDPAVSCLIANEGKATGILLNPRVFYV